MKRPWMCLAAAATAFVATWFGSARASGCGSWPDVAATVATVADPAARASLLLAVTRIQAAADCVEYEDAVSDFITASSAWGASGALTLAEETAIDECFHSTLNGLAACGVIATSATEKHMRCKEDRSTCESAVNKRCQFHRQSKGNVYCRPRSDMGPDDPDYNERP